MRRNTEPSGSAPLADPPFATPPLSHAPSILRSLSYRASIALAALALIGLGALLFFHRPSGQFFFPRCTAYQLTGLLCPGCGGLRAIHELLHGNLAEAARSNLLVLLGPLAVAIGWTWRRRLGHRGHLTGRSIWYIFAALALFAVVRNLPGLPSRWLTP